jgi:hypothetical protein
MDRAISAGAFRIGKRQPDAEPDEVQMNNTIRLRIGLASGESDALLFVRAMSRVWMLVCIAPGASQVVTVPVKPIATPSMSMPDGGWHHSPGQNDACQQQSQCRLR